MNDGSKKEPHEWDQNKYKSPEYCSSFDLSQPLQLKRYRSQFHGWIRKMSNFTII